MSPGSFRLYDRGPRQRASTHRLDLTIRFRPRCMTVSAEFERAFRLHQQESCAKHSCATTRSSRPIRGTRGLHYSGVVLHHRQARRGHRTHSRVVGVDAASPDACRTSQWPLPRWTVAKPRSTPSRKLRSSPPQSSEIWTNLAAAELALQRARECGDVRAQCGLPDATHAGGWHNLRWPSRRRVACSRRSTRIARGRAWRPGEANFAGHKAQAPKPPSAGTMRRNQRCRRRSRESRRCRAPLRARRSAREATAPYAGDRYEQRLRSIGVRPPDRLDSSTPASSKRSAASVGFARAPSTRDCAASCLPTAASSCALCPRKIRLAGRQCSPRAMPRRAPRAPTLRREGHRKLCQTARMRRIGGDRFARGRLRSAQRLQCKLCRRPNSSNFRGLRGELRSFLEGVIAASPRSTAARAIARFDRRRVMPHRRPTTRECVRWPAACLRTDAGRRRSNGAPPRAAGSALRIAS